LGHVHVDHTRTRGANRVTPVRWTGAGSRSELAWLPTQTHDLSAELRG
jgi:hypothetical protein